MSSSVGVILAHDDRTVAEQVTEALEQAPDLFVAATALDATAGSVIVAGGEALARLRSPERPVVALATGDVVRAARAALAAGAADIVRWPEEAERLPHAIRRATARRDRVSRGRVVAVASARGGTGASTFAALLAVALEAMALDLSGGQRAFAPDEPVRTLEDLRAPLTEVTADALEALASPHAAGRAIYVPELFEPVGVAGAHAVVRAARGLADVVVVDAGTCATAGLRAAVAGADVHVLVAADDVTSVRRATALRLGDGLVVVRRRRRGGIALRDLRSALGHETAVIREDAPLARAIDLGTLPGRPTRTTRAAESVAAALKERWA